MSDNNKPEGVGTGAGEGAPRQDTGSAWVTRSADCPEAPAQAHPLDLDALAAVAQAATPGPWEAFDANEGDGNYRPFWMVANDAFHNPPDDDDTPWIAVEIHTGTRHDADYIATFDPPTVRALLAEVAALRQQVAEVKAERDWLSDVAETNRAAYEHAVEARLCSQCGERMSCMIKIGTSDGWCETCLDEAADSAQARVIEQVRALAEITRDDRMRAALLTALAAAPTPPAYQPCSHECNGCPTCDPGLAPTPPSEVEPVELSAEERAAIGCRCWRLDGVWHHRTRCLAPNVERLIALRLGYTPPTEAEGACGSPTCDGTNPKTWCLWNEGRCAIRERAEKETPDV